MCNTACIRHGINIVSCVSNRKSTTYLPVLSIQPRIKLFVWRNNDPLDGSNATLVPVLPASAPADFETRVQGRADTQCSNWLRYM